MKQIIVEKCGVGECPYCIPDSTSKRINYCGAYENHQTISSNIKTFPNICPLEKVKQANETP